MTIGVRHDERELTRAVDLCLPDGRLNHGAVGWSRHPLHRCNLPESLGRKKRWNYWCITDGDVLFSVTVADIDLAQLAFVYVYDIATKQFGEKTVVAAAGSVPMPETPAGEVVFGHDEMRVAMTDEGSATRIRVDCADFNGARLRADVLIERPDGHETLNVVIPWDDEQFQFTSKQNTLPVSGELRWGERSYALDTAAYSCLDFGRGVWPHETRWNWGAASGEQDGRLVGLNLGGGWTDGTGMTENAICVDGRLTKISEDLRFDYLHDDLMAPWRVSTAVTGCVDLHFNPLYERIAKGGNDAYFSEVHQLFGHYDGSVTPDGGEAIAIRQMFGWIESHDARW
jgi:hypothetical protein